LLVFFLLIFQLSRLSVNKALLYLLAYKKTMVFY